MKWPAQVLLIAIGVVPALGLGTAWAAGETTVTSHARSGGGFALIVKAAPATANQIAVTGADGIAVKDAAGIIESPDTPECSQANRTRVNCSTQGLRRVSVLTGDLNDVLRWATFPSSYPLKLSTGGGNDRVEVQGITEREGNDSREQANIVKLGSGNDRARVSGPASVYGEVGKDRLIGGIGSQRLFGGSGRDRLSGGKGKKDYCHGGGATDRISPSCEKIMSP